MHRVQNYGSVLQAYALQQYFENLGYKTEIIDYIYPNEEHLNCKNTKKKKLTNYLKLILKYPHDFFLGFPLKKKKNKFNKFIKDKLILSKRKYLSSRELIENPPPYDIYLTGSDQVWNPIHVKGDTSFMFSFGDDHVPRYAYAASFSTSRIPDEYRGRYAQALSKYKAISVRERSGVDVVKALVNKDSRIVCDPTLLLSKSQWSKLIDGNKVGYKEPYILVYVLGYAYNPYPGITNIIRKVQKCLGMRVIYLTGRFQDYFEKNSTVVRDAGPEDFINLFLNASFVITTSFHGTCFSLNFEVPFYAVVQRDTSLDSRILSLLHMVDVADRAIIYNHELKELNSKINYNKINPYLKDFVCNSCNFIKDIN